MSKSFVFVPGQYYYVCNHSIDRQQIFFDRVDYYRFKALLYLANNKSRCEIRGRDYRSLLRLFKKVGERRELVDIGAYAIRPDGFCILLREKVDGGTTLFMQKVTTGYSMYFNKKSRRRGPLFMGCFRSRHAKTESCLKYLLSLIHLSPLKLVDISWTIHGVGDETKAEQFLKQYEYTSYHDFVDVGGDRRKQEIILNKKAFPSFFCEENNFSKHLEGWRNLRHHEKEFNI